MTRPPSRIRVLVVEDSAFNRRALTEMLASAPDIEVVAKATDGDEGLRLALTHQPDAITLDLGLPGLDGFTFLRLLMAKAPTPVVVVSAYSRKEDVFQALDLGAVDFIAKPTRRISRDFLAIREELIAKVRNLRSARKGAHYDDIDVPAASVHTPRKLRIAVIGASTGGPPAIEHLVRALPPQLPLGIAIVQHMPAQFTRTFAERLARGARYEVVEARDGDFLGTGKVLIAPGGHHLTLVESESRVRAVVTRRDTEKYVPSIDRLFDSAASLAARFEVAGVVLTGMGDDGKEGVKRLSSAGAMTIAESEESAVIFGMPHEAIRTGAVRQVLPLRGIAMALARFGRGTDKVP
jgi:two-component system, chemotaxis family, protein-glutamate methylesterase/glutaminase